MIGVFSLVDTDRDFNPRTKVFNDFHFENYFNSLQEVQNTLKFLNSGKLNKDELNLVKTNLNNLPIESPTIHYEVLKNEQENLRLRTEGILGDIWEKIKAFFKWIVDKIKSLLGIENSKTPEKQEVKETQEQFHKFDYNPDNDPFIKNLKKQTEQLIKDMD